MANDFLRSMVGRWRGEEKVWMDPAGSEPTIAEASFETTLLIGGAAVGADYVQTIDDAQTMRSYSLIRIGESASIEYSWFAEGGPPRLFSGHVDNKIAVAEGDINGVLTRFTQDYSKPGRMETHTTTISANGEERTVFEAAYQKLPDQKIGSIGWRDLTVKDAVALRDFYAAVTGWSFEGVAMGDHEDFNMKNEDGEATAGVCHALGENADLPPVWLNYVVVADLMASITETESRGGAVVASPRGLAGGKFCVIRDPVGAMIALWEQ